MILFDFFFIYTLKVIQRARESTEWKNNESFCKFIGGTLQLIGIERQLEDLRERGKEW